METLSRSEITREALRYMGLKCRGVPGPDTKEITFEYIVDANWNNYRALYCWAANIGIITPVTKQQTNGQADLTKLLPVRVYLLD